MFFLAYLLLLTDYYIYSSYIIIISTFILNTLKYS